MNDGVKKVGWWGRLVCKTFHSKHHVLKAIYGKENRRMVCGKCGYDFVGRYVW